MKTSSKSHTAGLTRHAPATLEAHALDAAFAEMPELLTRIDQAKSGGRNYADETRELVARIVDQMQALEQQRERLEHLLGELDVPCDL